MFKLIIILILLIYLLNKISVMLFRVFGRPQSPPFRGSATPPPPTSRPQRKGGLKGGEYVDFEEVK